MPEKEGRKGRDEGGEGLKVKGSRRREGETEER